MKNNLTFGEALEAVKQGSLISREGWNGKGMFLWLNKGSYDISYLTNNDYNVVEQGIDRKLFNIGDKDTITRLPNINMKSASGATVTGWLASQTDMLANDWCVLD